jgi:hypothetical protein
MRAQTGKKPPPLQVSTWVQGEATDFEREKGRVVLVEVFQVNCPGCFLYALPQAVGLHRQYQAAGLTVLGVATAFEDFDKNTVENLRLLVERGEVIGATRAALGQYGLLTDHALPFRIPFPVAMDLLHKQTPVADEASVQAFIREKMPDFPLLPAAQQSEIIQQVKDYLATKEYTAATFESFALQGTPSHILVDREGILRETGFGGDEHLEAKVQALLRE